MIIREFREEDIATAKQIYYKYYEDIEEIDFTKLLCAFTVLDDNGSIVTIGGLKPLVELVALTDKGQSTRNRRRALVHLFQATLYTAINFKYDEIHLFTCSREWTKHLIKAGFQLLKDKVLTIGVQNG